MKRSKKIFLLILVLLCSLILEGCWDVKELDDLTVPLFAAIDKALESEKEYP